MGAEPPREKILIFCFCENVFYLGKRNFGEEKT